ncbi:hypothetical protein C1I95_31420 [Micromonospora craterilacus]|uniref:Uncharacterized protein n=1 Tax=Micromonospora craterilacus TaxID=1655439 RepID=A0A2W2ERH9_9ACTN|nr:hypothetical protein [Micromonospora craterilacus]PZG07184.1 hypothetical protein C1I95_31420 [Micromonospora craterilacus]
MADLPCYEGWRQVPAGLLSKSQLADLDLPRVPGGAPVRARVETRDWRDHKTVVDLYSLGETLPSAATIGQLEAARARASASRVCEDCGARPDRSLPCVNGRHLCQLCSRILSLQELAEKAGAERAGVVAWARQILASDLLPPYVVRVKQILRPPAPSGRQNLDPVAVWVDAVDTTGRRLVNTTIRLAGPRVRAVPAGAVDPTSVEEQIRTLLAAPVIVTWFDKELSPLHTLYGVKTAPGWYGGNPNAMSWRATYWRGDVNPDAYHFTRRSAINPVRADRTLLILRRIAATGLPDDPA